MMRFVAQCPLQVALTMVAAKRIVKRMSEIHDHKTIISHWDEPVEVGIDPASRTPHGMTPWHGEAINRIRY